MAKEKPKARDADTERIVFVRVDPTVGKPDEGDLSEVWAPVLNEDGSYRIFRGTKQAVIDEYAGKGEDARPGEYRAPNASAWRGTRKVVLPDKPKPERLWAD